jgi:hypothetical protein
MLDANAVLGAVKFHTSGAGIAAPFRLQTEEQSDGN